MHSSNMRYLLTLVWIRTVASFHVVWDASSINNSNNRRPRFSSSSVNPNINPKHQQAQYPEDDVFTVPVPTTEMEVRSEMEPPPLITRLEVSTEIEPPLVDRLEVSSDRISFESPSIPFVSARLDVSYKATPPLTNTAPQVSVSETERTNALLESFVNVPDATEPLTRLDVVPMDMILTAFDTEPVTLPSPSTALQRALANGSKKEDLSTTLPRTMRATSLLTKPQRLQLNVERQRQRTQVEAIQRLARQPLSDQAPLTSAQVTAFDTLKRAMANGSVKSEEQPTSAVVSPNESTESDTSMEDTMNAAVESAPPSLLVEPIVSTPEELESIVETETMNDVTQRMEPIVPDAESVRPFAVRVIPRAKELDVEDDVAMTEQLNALATEVDALATQMDSIMAPMDATSSLESMEESQGEIEMPIERAGLDDPVVSNDMKAIEMEMSSAPATDQIILEELPVEAASAMNGMEMSSTDADVGVALDQLTTEAMQEIESPLEEPPAEATSVVQDQLVNEMEMISATQEPETDPSTASDQSNEEIKLQLDLPPAEALRAEDDTILIDSEMTMPEGVELVMEEPPELANVVAIDDVQADMTEGIPEVIVPQSSEPPVEALRVEDDTILIDSEMTMPEGVELSLEEPPELANVVAMDNVQPDMTEGISEVNVPQSSEPPVGASSPIVATMDEIADVDMNQAPIESLELVTDESLTMKPTTLEPTEDVIVPPVSIIGETTAGPTSTESDFDMSQVFKAAQASLLEKQQLQYTSVETSVVATTSPAVPKEVIAKVDAPVVVKTPEQLAQEADAALISFDVKQGVSEDSIKGAALAGFALSTLAGNALPVSILLTVPLTTYLSVCRGLTGEIVRTIGAVTWNFTTFCAENVGQIEFDPSTASTALESMSELAMNVQLSTRSAVATGSAWLKEQRTNMREYRDREFVAKINLEAERMKQPAERKAEREAAEEMKVLDNLFFVARPEQMGGDSDAAPKASELGSNESREPPQLQLERLLDVPLEALRSVQESLSTVGASTSNWFYEQNANARELRDRDFVAKIDLETERMRQPHERSAGRAAPLQAETSAVTESAETTGLHFASTESLADVDQAVDTAMASDPMEKSLESVEQVETKTGSI